MRHQHLCLVIAGALAFPKAFHLGGDIHDKAYSRARDNVESLEREGTVLGVDVAQWDATRLSLREGCVDVFVTDLPFGKRSGSKADNRVLYPATMLSLARAARLGTGRAVLLTQDKNSMFKVGKCPLNYVLCSHLIPLSEHGKVQPVLEDH